uniref:Uncharacterized protein n=1 Tax=Anguilla anguilla TaxID=7936 RepID=A0A0E9SQE8_ANGAN
MKAETLQQGQINRQCPQQPWFRNAKGHTVEFFKHITDDLSVTIPIPIQIGFHIVTIEVQFYLPKPQEFQTPRIKLTQK